MGDPLAWGSEAQMRQRYMTAWNFADRLRLQFWSDFGKPSPPIEDSHTEENAGWSTSLYQVAALKRPALQYRAERYASPLSRPNEVRAELAFEVAPEVWLGVGPWFVIDDSHRETGGGNVQPFVGASLTFTGDGIRDAFERLFRN